ncbi:nucleotide-binding protein [Leucobacter insecticola]|uniref:Nucleotide-binding protein n=1 Tax=Leucobacter insecticola TaxID=2714934 RepID=A0A6G8FLI1_9MICO|nr:nucleotide-binding protein [Leucobacter insecticola]
MTKASSPVRLFIGSSAEGREIARNLQEELGNACQVERWDQGVFEPSGYTLDSLLDLAKRVDFAVLIATPDDTTVSRGVEMPAARDNIILEFGLFAGALGRDRVYLLATDQLKLPTDVLGLTRLPYHSREDGNYRAAVNGAALQIEQRISALGPFQFTARSKVSAVANNGLDQELAILCANAVAQGWTVKTNSPTTLRLRSPKGKAHTFSKGSPNSTREALRKFASELSSGGLRVNNSIRRPVVESPFSTT